MATSLIILRLRYTLARFKPPMKWLYEIPRVAHAALSRRIHSARNSRFLTRRSRYAYWPALMTAYLATLKSLLRVPRYPFAARSTRLRRRRVA